MKRFAPTKEQLERLPEFRAAAYGDDADDHEHGSYVKLAALLGLPKPKPEPEELDWKHFPYQDEDEDDFEVKPGDFTDAYSTEPGDEDVLLERIYSEDFIKRRDAHQARVKKAKAEVDAERAAYELKREASQAVHRQWEKDNAALFEAMGDWSDYFWRLDNPKEAAEQDAEQAKEQREAMFSTLQNLKRFLKAEVAESTIGELVSNAFSTWQELGEEMRTSQENMEEKFSATQKYQDIEQCADTLENFSEPTVPDNLKDVLIAYFVGKYTGSRNSRNQSACDDVQTVLDYIAENCPDDDEGLAGELEDAKSEAEGLNFPGWYG